MNNPQIPRVPLLFPNQYAEAAAVLGRAFVEDPLLLAIVGPAPDSQDRARRMARVFASVLRDHRAHGQPVWGVLADGQIAAAAVVEHVARPSSALSAAIGDLSGLPSLLKALGWSGLMRGLSALDILTRNRPPEPHLYLNILGVEPQMQRRHFGAAILDHLREQAAPRSGVAGVYLETAAEANVAYYTRFGYRVIGEIHPLGVRMWRMLQPRAAG
jgi:ribosomal protein S18 acetylase RimI-like enzyme